MTKSTVNQLVSRFLCHSFPRPPPAARCSRGCQMAHPPTLHELQAPTGRSSDVMQAVTPAQEQAVQNVGLHAQPAAPRSIRCA